MRRAIQFLLLFVAMSARAQPYASWTRQELKLNNGVVTRTVKLPAPYGHFITASYKPSTGKFDYLDSTSTDFQFSLNRQVYSGRSNWRLKSIAAATDSRSGNGATVVLVSADKKIELSVQYLLYPGSPAVHKILAFKNISTDTLQLEDVDIEKLETTAYYSTTFSWIYHDYGRRKALSPYNGDFQDALMIVHNPGWQQGIVIGNEASGVIKHTSVFYGESTICTGLTHHNTAFPFRKYIKPGDSFATPPVFTMVYNGVKDPAEILDIAVPQFVNNYLGTRLAALKDKPTFVYNTWEPFRFDINEKLIMDLAKAAAAAGMKEFVIDDGWSENYGDWVIDRKKFPHGLKPVFDYIKKLGMKPGLWISIGSASSKSKVFKEHPEWFVKDERGALTSLHISGDTERYTACFSTGWYDYIKNVLAKLSVEYGLEYMKLDFSVVTSPYVFDNKQSGCYATDHPGHRDHPESLYANYEQVWKLFDELHAIKPDLFIDCTFEAMGGLQLIDYAMLKHAEGNWLSNFGKGDDLDLRIRNMAWWRSPAMPATALIIGNPEMQDKGWQLHIKSLAGALPIMLGDPRKLSDSDFTQYKMFANWLGLMNRRYQTMSYRQDLKGFGEPTEGMWDGFQRINTDNSAGGIVGVFRQGSVEPKRRVTIQYLQLQLLYEVKTMDGRIVKTLTGKDLSEKGFEVELNRLYDGELFEIAVKK